MTVIDSWDTGTPDGHQPYNPATAPPAGTVAMDWNGQKTANPTNSPLNTTGVVSAQVSDGTNFGVAAWTINPDGTQQYLGFYTQTGAWSTAAFTPTWAISGASGGATGDPNRYDFEPIGELRVGDVEAGAADGTQVRVYRTVLATGVTTMSTLDSDGTVDSGRPVFNAPAAAAAATGIVQTAIETAGAGAYTWPVGTLVGWVVQVTLGTADIDGVTVGLNEGVAVAIPPNDLAVSVATVPVTVAAGSEIRVTTQTIV